MSYILLAGGEPLLRRDIVEAAGKMQNTLWDGGLLADDHVGGCILYEKREQVEELLGGQTVFT